MNRHAASSPCGRCANYALKRQKGGLIMANWLTPNLISEKYGIPESTLRSWKCLGYITSSTIDEHLLLDEDSLINLLKIHKSEALGEDYLQKIIKEKELERELLLSRCEDELFMLKTVMPYRELFRVVIHELGQLIPDKRLRDIFLAVSLGEPIVQIAKRHEMKYQEVVTTYKDILVDVSKNMGRIASLTKVPQNPLIFKYNTPDPTSISLSSLMQFHAYNVLKAEGEIHTVGDLMKHTQRYGWKSLMNFRYLGKSTYKEIVETMQEGGFIVIREDGTIEPSPDLEPWVI